MVSFYLLTLVCVGLWGTKSDIARKRTTSLLMVWWIFGVAYLPLAQRFNIAVTTPKLQVTFIDVGHGCHTWIRFPDGRYWCYDAGRMGDHERSYQVMVNSLWAERVLRIDTLLLSHGDSDHYNGMIGVAERFPVRRFATTRSVLEHRESLVQQLVQGLADKSAVIETLKQGDVERIANCRIVVLHPSGDFFDSSELGSGAREYAPKSDNAQSLCLLLEFAGRKVLLPGDIEPPGTQELLKQSVGEIDVLMAPHHGSLRSQGERIAEWCRAKHVVVSGALRSLSPKVDELYEAPDRSTWYTARDRALRFTIQGSGLVQIERWNSKRWERVSY